MAKLERMSRPEILRMIKPAFFANYGEYAGPEWEMIKSLRTADLRDEVRSLELDIKSVRDRYIREAGMAKGGAVKKPKMNKGGMVDHRKKGLFK